MKIYIIHYDKLIKRKINMEHQLLENNLVGEFVSNYGKEILTINDKKMFRNLTDSEISLALHHIQCYKYIASGSDEYALILEDDAIFDNTFNDILQKYIQQLPEDWDMLFIGNGGHFHIPNNIINNRNTNIFKKENTPTSWGGGGATRCLDSYLISNKCAKIIVDKLKQSNYTILCPVDHWLNHVIRINNFNIYWAEPTIVSQGTENGIFKSSIR